MKITEHICPRCKRKTVSKDARRCLNLECLTPLLFPGDDGRGIFEGETQWFMWMPHGERGAGWYRRSLLEEAPLVENNAADMQARALAQY